jgi:hypothetical protein
VSIGYDQRRTSFSQIQDKGFRTTSSTPLTNNGFIFRGGTGAEAVDANVSASVRRRLGQDLNTRFTARYLFEQRDEELNTGQGRSLSVKGVTSLGNVTTNQAVASSSRGSPDRRIPARLLRIQGALHHGCTGAP